RNSLNPTLAHLPAAARAAAGSSITSTQAIAQQLGKSGQFLLTPANDSFVHAMHYTTLVAAAIALLGGVVALRWTPGKPKPRVEDVELALISEDAMVRTAKQEG